MFSGRSPKSNTWANAGKKLMRYDETEISITSTYDAEDHKQRKDSAEHKAKNLKKHASASNTGKQKETNKIDPKSIKAVKQLLAKERVQILCGQFAKAKEELALSLIHI